MRTRGCLFGLVAGTVLGLSGLARADQQWPSCVSNGGQGYGTPWTDASNTQLAKDSADLNDSSTCVVTTSPIAQPVVGASGFPYCVSNDGQGFGNSWTDTNNNPLAKDNSDLDDASTCQVTGEPPMPAASTAPDPAAQPSAPTSASSPSGYPYCISNGGQGFGNPWADSNNNTLAKDSADLNDASTCQVDGIASLPAPSMTPDTSAAPTTPTTPTASTVPTTASGTVGPSGYPYCINNGGRGFGNSWTDSNNDTLAKYSADLNDASICQIDSQTAAVGSTPSTYPDCVNNGGEGFGTPWTDSDNNVLAKDSADLSDNSICYVITNPTTPTQVNGGYPHCLKNQGQGYGNSWNDGSQTLAKDSPDLNDASTCIVLNGGGTAQSEALRVVNINGVAANDQASLGVKEGDVVYLSADVLAGAPGCDGNGSCSNPENLYVNEFSWSASDRFDDYCDAANPQSCFASSNFRVTQYGISFYVDSHINSGNITLSISKHGSSLSTSFNLYNNGGNAPGAFPVYNSGPCGPAIYNGPAGGPLVIVGVPFFPHGFALGGGWFFPHWNGNGSAPTPPIVIIKPIVVIVGGAPKPVLINVPANSPHHPPAVHNPPAQPIHTLPQPQPIHTQPQPIHTQPQPQPIHTLPQPIHTLPQPIHTLPQPQPIHTQPQPQPIHTQPQPQPIHTQPQPQPIHTQPQPIHTQPQPQPIHTQPQPQPIHTQPQPQPIHTQPQPQPIHTQPQPQPIHTQPQPQPIHTQPQPQPIHTQPQPQPIHTQPQPQPIHTQPQPQPIHTQPQPQPIHTQPQPQPVHTQPQPQPVHTQPQPQPVHTQPQPQPVHTQPQPQPVHTQPQPQPVHTQPQPQPVHTQPQPQPVHTQPQPVHTQPQPVHVQPQPAHVQPQPVHVQPTHGGHRSEVEV